MLKALLTSFTKPTRHIASSEIIRRHSTNREDVREIALSRINLRMARRILDLGCGFGFMTKAITQRVANDVFVLGIDTCVENLRDFTKIIHAAGRQGEFKHFHITNKLPLLDKSFDLIIASYSLYFFSEIIPDVARVLRPEGIFLALTHCEDSLSGLYNAAGMSSTNSPAANLINNFSAENGRYKLNLFFKDIERVDYNNTLCFEKGHLGDLLEYTRFKLPLMLSESVIYNLDDSQKLPKDIEISLTETLNSTGIVKIEKCDAVFCCRRPICKRV